jgi:Na+-driven multidrug efflux pump
MIPLIYFLRKNSSILRLGETKFEGKVLIKATSNGLSEFMTNISMSIVAILFNSQLMKYSGENGVAAYGVMMYVSMIFTAVFVGFSIGASPVISFHFGAKNTDELKNLIRKSIVIVGTFGIIMVIAAEIFAGGLAKIFVGYDEELYRLTLSGFRVFALSFGFMGFGILTSGLFTALNDGLTSALISFLRTLVFESGAVMLLPLIFGIHGIWYSVVVSEFLALVLGAVFLVINRKKYHY